MQTHHIRGFTYELRERLLPRLTNSLAACGGWVLERKTLSATRLEFLIEIQLRNSLELYASLVGAGVELTRPGHETLTGLCTRRKYLRARQIGHVIVLRLEISFLEDVTLHGLLASGSGLA